MLVRIREFSIIICFEHSLSVDIFNTIENSLTFASTTNLLVRNNRFRIISLTKLLIDLSIKQLN